MTIYNRFQAPYPTEEGWFYIRNIAEKEGFMVAIRFYRSMTGYSIIKCKFELQEKAKEQNWNV